jgi:hypothetical protein
VTYHHGQTLYPTDVERLIAAVIDPEPFSRLLHRQPAIEDDRKRRRNAIRRAWRVLEALEVSGFAVVEVGKQRDQASADIR